MYHPIKIHTVILCLSLYGVTINAQTKFEREYRIKESEAPKLATKFISQGFPDQKIKWYIEESHEGKTFEAKTYYKKNKYSIEFNTQGNVLDIEKKIPFQSLEKNLKDKITTTLKTLFVKHRILKTQIQWKGDQKELLQLLNNTYKDNYPELYEIVIRGKKEKTFKQYELLMNPEGKAIRVLEIIQRTSDNLEF